MIARPKVLVVDDEEIVRINIERILESVNYEAKTAQSGQEAIQMVRREEFDLVLTDLIMEDVDGLRILEEVKRISPETIVIIVTGYGSLSSAVRAMQKGAFDYIIKPCGREELVLRVKKGIEKRELEMKLLEIKKMETILGNIGVFILDGKGVITNANPGISAKLWGKIQVVGRRLHELPGIASTGLINCFEQAVRGKGVSKENIRFYSPRDKKEFILSCHLRPIATRYGKPKSIMLIIEDLTKRTKVMQQISQAEKLAALGKLAAGVAHEINNPLNIISLDVEFLKSQIDPSSPMRENLQSISEEVERIAHIVQQLRDHAKMEESSQESINVNEVLNSHIFSIAFSQLMKKRIKVELNLEETVPQVMIPRTKITQVLMNLIKNAEDAMPEGGTLTISSHRVVQDKVAESEGDLRKYPPGIKDLVKIVVADTGVGIKPEDMSYLFEPFFTTKGFDGTGLGLFISYSIIKSYNGIIRVESETDKGTTFSIVLPSAGYNHGDEARAKQKQ
jgi:signal transduction histidine kinase/ActR/RegA family two-component response regulator